MGASLKNLTCCKKCEIDVVYCHNDSRLKLLVFDVTLLMSIVTLSNLHLCSLMNYFIQNYKTN